MQLVRSRSGRPSVIRADGGHVYIAVHDDEYMRQRADWRRRLADAHPDRGGSSDAFRALMVQRGRWQQAEARWYAQFGLIPPDGWDSPTIAAIRERAQLRSAHSSPPALTGRVRGRNSRLISSRVPSNHANPQLRAQRAGIEEESSHEEK